MDPKKVLCPCKKVTKGDILKAMDQGALKYKDVQKKTGAGSKCGHCEKEVKAFIKKQREKRAGA